MLGVHIVPIGNNKIQLKYMRIKAEKLIESISISQFPTYHRYLSLHFQLMDQLSYNLPVLQFSEKEFDEIFDILLPHVK